jgi:hypothetical protein
MPAGGLYLDGQILGDEAPEPRVIVQKEWAVYLYFGADNDYEGVTNFAIDQCVKGLVNSEADVNDIHVVALLDIMSVNGTWVYELTEDGRKADVDWNDDERNTSDPATLSEFLDHAEMYYPANKTLLVVKSGHAWCGVCPDVSEDAKCMMTIDGLASATRDRGIDVIALDGDNMAGIEVAYELRHSARYFVGTQQDMPLDGLPYYLTIKSIAEAPNMSAEEVSADLVCDFVYYYNNTDGKKNELDHQLANSQMAVTASATYLGEYGENIESVLGSFSDLMDYMVTGELPEYMGGGLAYEAANENWTWIPNNRSYIAAARDAALIGKMGDQAGYEWLPDLYTWFEALVYFVNRGNGTDYVLSDLVGSFNETFNNTIVRMDQSQILNRSGLSTPHGLNMWFPPSWTQWDVLNYSRERTYYYNGSRIELPVEVYCVDCPFFYGDVGLDIVEDTLWMSFFSQYYDSKWTIYGSLEAPRETPLWIE